MILIVGAGITGLYTGYQLLKKGKKFVILEKNKIGGKLITQKFGDTFINCGPSVLNSKQEVILDLLKELNIEVLNTDTKFYSFHPLKKVELKEGTIGDNYTSKDLTSYYETKYMSIKDYLTCLSNEGTYMYPKDGFKQIIDKLYSILKPYIKRGSLTYINNEDDKIIATINNRSYTYNDIIICTTMTSLYNIKFSKPLITKGMTRRNSSLRVFLYLNKNCEVLFPLLKEYNMLYRYDFGLLYKVTSRVVQVIYTDNDNCNGSTKMKNMIKILESLNMLDSIIDIKYYYFRDAYDTLTDIDVPYRLGNHIYQTASPDRGYQCWLEGNLRMAKKIIENF